MLPSNIWQARFEQHLPIYEQIVQRFCRGLVSGELFPAQRIPSIRDLALELGVNTNTVQRAYQEMERSELIYSKRGTGYFIVEDEGVVRKIRGEMVTRAVDGFLREMYSLGFENAAILEELQKQMKGGTDRYGTAES